MHFLVQWPKIIVEPALSHIFFPHCDCLHKFVSTLEPPTQSMVLTLSTNGERFARSCFTFSQQSSQVGSAATLMTPPSVFPMLSQRHFALIYIYDCKQPR